MFNLIFVVTCVDDKHINKMLSSVINNNFSLSILILFVNQSNLSISLTRESEFIKITEISSDKCSLSKARNIALNYLIDNSISAEYIMFPDDDSSFDQNFFIHFSSILNSNVSYLTPIFNEGTKDLYFGKLLKNNCFVNENMHSLVGSPNQIILYDKFKEHIFFDEDLGIGAKYGSCEDYDLFIRLNRFGATYFFITSIYSYHPSKLTKNTVPKRELVKRYKSYSPGFVFIIKKYSKYRFIPSFIIRPFVGSVIKLLMFDFKMASVYSQVFFFRISLLYKNLL